MQDFDEPVFAQLTENHRYELQVHCYRMLGSFDDSEDLVQETFLRAWNKRDTFEGRSSARAWLYRIATNACLDFLAHHSRKPQSHSIEGRAAGAGQAPPHLSWLQPYPDRLLSLAAPSNAEPDAAAVAKETIELAFLVAIQHLPPRQRAVLILRDVLGYPAGDIADVLDVSVPAVNSALQRARLTLKKHLPPRREEWRPTEDPTVAERRLLQRYMQVMEWSDADAIAEAMTELVAEDVRVTMPPHPIWFVGRESFIGGMRVSLDPESPGYVGEWRCVPTRANTQLAVAQYLRAPGDDAFRAQVVNVLRLQAGMIAEITAFGDGIFPALGLPAVLDEQNTAPAYSSEPIVAGRTDG
ncbi:RNA polymerase subunit sigma-70 [Winogradskya consettensis]|uniref:RNA polymerase sigma factor n=1 Tax=Winogradskya consettensis TaxID=113560 RepID=A0A919SA99_9ACTN|nr:RNA polymerase sigma factor [Actinoplanes consettensis]